MRSLLIRQNGSFMFVTLPVRLRGKLYQVADPPVLSAKWDEWHDAPMAVATITFQWCGQIVRKDGSDLLDLFEEV